jgi:hypothetical protein
LRSRGGLGDYPVDVLCFGGKKSGERGGAARRVKAQRLLIRNGALDVGADGVELAPSSQRGLICRLEPWDDSPVGFRGYSHALGQHRFAGSRRMSAETGLSGHAEKVIRPKTCDKSPYLATSQSGY